MVVSTKLVTLAQNFSWIRKMFESGAQMKAEYGAENVFDFSIGNPDVAPPPEFKQVLLEVASDTTPGVHGYMPNGGYPWVLDAIAERISIEQNMHVTGRDMIMTCGAAGGLNILMKTLLDPGDEILLLAPYFVDYCSYIDNHGGVSKVVQTDEEFNIDLAAIKAAITEKTKGIFINSPNNPTGQIYSKESLAELGKLLEKTSAELGTTIFMISDEPYRKLVFDGHEVPSIFNAYRNSIVVTSYSKDLSLPGERIGFVAVNPEIVEKAAILNGLTLANRILGFINAPALMQRIVSRLQNVNVDTSVYARRKDLICKVLDEAGYSYTAPKGAFYIFPKSPIADELKFVSMLQDEKILTVPGVGFGTPGYIRIAFCVPSDVISRSADGFKRAFDKAKSM